MKMKPETSNHSRQACSKSTASTENGGGRKKLSVNLQKLQLSFTLHSAYAYQTAIAYDGKKTRIIDKMTTLKILPTCRNNNKTTERLAFCEKFLCCRMFLICI